MPTQTKLSGNPDIDGLLWGYKWDFTNLTWGLPNSPAAYAGYGSGDIVGFQSLNTPQYLALIRGIIGQFDAVCGLTFTLIGDAAVANIRYAKAAYIDVGDGRGLHVPGAPSAEAVPPDPTRFPLYPQGDLWFSYDVRAPPPLGSFQYTAWLIHEAGHGLGLKHGHHTQLTHEVLFPKLPFDHDSQEYSVMTYRGYPGGQTGAASANSDYPTTLMQADIAALQYMYGADYTTNSGNTTYAWSPGTGEMFINGVGQGAHFRHKVFLTIWDGGGTDTYDMSNYANNVAIDLRPGNWSITSTAQLADLAGQAPGTHLARGNIANAQVDPNHPNETRSLIENANGGSGNDQIVGNRAANFLTGGGGNDSIDGGPGGDVVGYNGVRLAYTIAWTDGATVSSSADGTDHLTNIEAVRFSDKTEHITPKPLDYIASHPDLMAAFGPNPAAGFDHFLRASFNEGRTITFSGLEYTASYTDLMNAFGASPDSGASHYITRGRSEGRATSFDGLEYIASYGDLINAFGESVDTGTTHYITAGRFEGRATTFDGLEYIASYGDLINVFHTQVAANSNPEIGANHYIVAGYWEGRAADLFDPAQYLANYSDLRLVFGTNTDAATVHFITAGYFEGRTDDPI